MCECLSVRERQKGENKREKTKLKAHLTATMALFFRPVNRRIVKAKVFVAVVVGRDSIPLNLFGDVFRAPSERR